MIINNAASRRDVDFWTKHLQNEEENQRAELVQIRGLSADNLKDALLEMQREARDMQQAGVLCKNLKNFMYHADFNPARQERLTEEQWERVFEIFEQKRGIPSGQPRVVYEHEKEGRIHRHVIWTRVDHENQRATPDGLDAKVAHAAAREIEIELGLEKVIGPFDREPGTPRPPRAPEPWEMYRGMKSKIDPRDVAEEVTELFHQSETGKAFHAALEQHGYQLVTGDRGLLILDSAGKDHSLARRLQGVTTKELNAFMREVDRDALPTVQQAKADYQQRKEAGLKNELAEVQQEIEQLSVQEMDKFLAAQFYQNWTRDAASYEQQWQITLEHAPGVAREIEKLISADRDEQETRAAAERQGELAEIDKFIAVERERREQQPAPVWDRDAYESAWQHSITQAAIEHEKAARQFAESKPGRETRAGGNREKEPAHPTPAPELGKTQGEIRLARSLSHGPQSFANALEDRGFILARVTADDIQREMAQLTKEWEERRRNPQTWMEHDGGFKALSPELQDSARRSFDEWEKQRDEKNKNKPDDKERQPPQKTYTVEDYVDYVQKKWLEGPKSQLERATGQLAVITPFGSIYTLTSRNTGLDRDELPRYLRNIDRAPLLSVTDAQAVMQEVKDHRRKEWMAQLPPLSKTAGEIRLAYSLTQTGQQFADALEDRGFILARMTDTDAERLNRWERQRLKEEWQAPAPEKIGRKTQTGKDGAEDFEKYRAGELVVVNQYGQVFQLTAHNTGNDKDERLKGIDPAPLLSVTTAQSVMQEVRDHRREEWIAQLPLSRTAGEIRLAYSLTKTGQEFADALEDRGFILARTTEADAERLNRWERQRLKEEWQAPSPEKIGRKTETGKHGGAEYEKYRAGELAVVNQYGQVFPLTLHNTGSDKDQRLKDIDHAPLLSVTTAQGVMKDVRQHRQEERQQAWQQRREEWLRPAREAHWPTQTQQPEHESKRFFEQAATEASRDHRTEDLKGAAAHVWKVFRQSGNEEIFKTVLDEKDLFFVKTGDRTAFAAALEEKGIAFAAVTKEEADKSRSKEAEFARAVGNYTPRYKQGEIVIVTTPRLEHRRDGEPVEPQRVYKLDPSLAAKYVKLLDNRSQLQGIEATKQALDGRAEQRATEREAVQFERATDNGPALARTVSKGVRQTRQTIHAAADLAKAPARAMSEVLNVAGSAAGIIFSLVDAPKSPRVQERENREAERATDRRNAEEEIKIDFTQYSAARQQQETQRQQEEQHRERERDR